MESLSLIPLVLTCQVASQNLTYQELERVAVFIHLLAAALTAKAIERQHE